VAPDTPLAEVMRLLSADPDPLTVGDAHIAPGDVLARLAKA
jgi:hypothetical protein